MPVAASAVPTRSSRGRSGAPGLGDQARRADRGDQAERQVDEEDQPPAAPEQVGVDERAADDRPQHRRQADHGAEDRERRGLLRGRERVADDPEPLRDQERGGAALSEPAGDQHLRRDRERARHRREHESDRAEHEQALAAVDVAESPTGDQPDGEREGVAADHPLQRGRAAVQVGADRRGGDVDDRAVEQIHALRGEHEREDRPLAWMADPG